MKTRRFTNSGFTMVEMMVAIVVGLIVLGGLIQITATQKQAFRLQQSANFLQENARFAVRTLDYGLRMADHWGGVESRNVTGNPTISAGSGICDSTWVTNVDEGIMGFDGSGSTPLDCINAANYELNTDMLVIRYARPSFPGALDGNQVYLRVGVGTDGVLFLGSDGLPSEIPTEDGVYTYPLAVDVFHVRPCSDPGADNVCDADDDDGTPMPTLVSLRLQSNGNLQIVPLVEGVEQLQFEYGVDVDSDRDVDTFDNAANVTAGNLWNDVVAIRFSMLMRGDSRDVSLGSPGPFDLSTDTPSFSPGDAEWQRRVFTKIVQLRNRIRE